MDLMFFRIVFFCTCVISSVLHAASMCPEYSDGDKVALLFLTRSELNQPNLWRVLLRESGNEKRFSVYIHSKNGMNDPYFKRYCLTQTVPTCWEKHVKAWQVLIREALKDPKNKKFVFLTESCVPLYSLEYVYNVLMSDAATHMWYHRPWWGRGTRDVLEIDPQYRWGNSERMVLNRKHAEIIANDEQIIGITSQYHIDVESYFASLLAIHGCLHEAVNHTYFYELWDYLGRGSSPWSLNGVSDFNNRLIDKAYFSQNRYLFIRKIATDYPQIELLTMIRKHSKQQFPPT
jgi:hypothetical protein